MTSIKRKTMMPGRAAKGQSVDQRWLKAHPESERNIELPKLGNPILKRVEAKLDRFKGRDGQLVIDEVDHG